MSEQQELQPVFSIEKIYVKDLSLEIPNAPAVFLEQEQPEIDMQLANGAQQLEDGFFESSLTITVTAKLGEDIDPILGVACPNILFPYARETVSNLVGRAGFPPVLLSPINFEALYMQQRAEQAEAGNA